MLFCKFVYKYLFCSTKFDVANEYLTNYKYNNYLIYDESE